MKKYLSWVLIFLSVSNIAWVMVKNKAIISDKFDPKVYEKRYYQSQWVIPNSKTPISDEELFAYAGYRYIKGENPILINPETPPLGKYIMGLSILLFNNYRILAILSAFLVLGLTFFLGGALAVFLTAVNTIFLDQIIHSGQHDIYQTVFLLVFIIFYSLYLKKKKILYILLSGIAFGAFVSIKAFVLYYFLFNAWLVLFYLIRVMYCHSSLTLGMTKKYASLDLTKKIPLKKISLDFFILNVIALITFSLTYLQYFLHNGSFRSFLGVQKWIYLFYLSSSINQMRLLGNYLSLILFNRWRFWSEGYPLIAYENWSLVWPVIFLFGMFVVVKLFFSKLIKSNMVGLIISFVIIYNIFLLIVPVFPRYLLLLFLPLNILISVYFDKIYNSKRFF